MSNLSSAINAGTAVLIWGYMWNSPNVTGTPHTVCTVLLVVNLVMLGLIVLCALIKSDRG